MKNIAKYKIPFENAVVYENELWFVSLNNTWLCKMDLKSFVAEKVCDIPGIQEGLYQYEIASCVDGYIVIMPLFGDCVIGYDIEKKEFETWNIKRMCTLNSIDGGDSIKFRSAAFYEDSTWLMPQGARGIIAFNHQSKKITEYTDIFDELKEMDINVGAYFGKGCIADGSIWLPCVFTNSLFEFNIEKKLGIMHRIGNSDNTYEACTYCNGRVFLVDNRKQLLVSYDINNSVFEVISKLPEDFGVDEGLKEIKNSIRYKIYCMVNLDENILLVPSCGNYFLLYDTENKKVHKIWKKTEGESYMSCVNIYDNLYLICSQKTNKSLLYSIGNGCIEKEIFTYAPFDYDNVIAETDMSLDDYMSAILTIE